MLYMCTWEPPCCVFFTKPRSGSNLTPWTLHVVLCRPRWDKCGRYVEGGEERWLELANNRGSDELVDVLLAEMTGTDIAIIQAGASTGDEFFEGQVSVPCAFPSPGIKV